MLDNLKNWIIETVIWAENALPGKPGSEKRKAVIDRLAGALFSVIKLPWYLGWAKGFIATKAIGYLVDLACEKLNLIGGWGFEGITLNSSQINELSSVLDAPASVLDVSAGASYVDRLDELYRRYGVNKTAPVPAPTTSAVPERTVSEGVEDRVQDNNRLSANLTRAEIACKCGCGFNIVDPKLVDTFQALRDYIGKPIIITSGCRCSRHNKKVGGAASSGHLYGQAIDCYVRGFNKEQFGKLVKEAQLAGLLPHLTFCYLIESSKACLHFGVDTLKRNSIFAF